MWLIVTENRACKTMWRKKLFFVFCFLFTDTIFKYNMYNIISITNVRNSCLNSEDEYRYKYDFEIIITIISNETIVKGFYF